MGILEEQDGTVVGVSWPFPSSLLHNIEYIYMNTSGLICHFPAADMIEWVWLGILYLINVIHVVHKVICTPPLISLV